MSGSVNDSDACGTDWEKWIPQIDSTDEKYNFTWKPPWKNFRIKICSNNKVLDNTSGFLIPLKMQFLITHHLSTVQKIIRNLESSIVESINSTEELLEIKVKSLEGEDIFTEIERALARETDDIVMKPIQRLEFTSILVEELFKKELKEQCIDLMRDETNIFVVGFEHMKSLITKNIDEINRLTATKVVKLEDKWKVEAIKCFGITETLSKTFSDVVVRLQEETSSVYLKGRDVTINKAEKEVHQLLSDLFNEKLPFDPLTLKLLNSKETSKFFNEILQKEHLQVGWTVDSTHLYSFSKNKIDKDALKTVVYEHFLTAGFSKAPKHENQFFNSNTFIETTKKQNNKLLFLETTKSGVNIAGTKNLICYLLHQEKLFYSDVGNAKEIQVDTLSLEIASIKDVNMKIDRERRELEVKLNDETQKRKNANDQYQSLERKCKEGEEKLKRITLEKELLQKESRRNESNLITQLEELKKTERQTVDTLSLEIASIKDVKMKIDREKRELEVKLNDETRKRKNANDQYQSLERKFKEREEKLKRITLEKEILIKESRDKETNFITQIEELKPWNNKKKKIPRASFDTLSRSIPRKKREHRLTQPSGCQQSNFQIPNSAFAMAFTWELMNQIENVKIVTLPPAEKEYQDVVQNFQTNMAGLYNSIIKIERIQNRALRKQYEAKQTLMDSTNTTGINNERILWHGTTMEAVGNINAYGFNRSYCGMNDKAYGDGVYFAVNPAYSAHCQAQYARPDPNGNKRMYMCKVLVGEFTKGQGGMKVPPPKPGAAGGHTFYDSVVDKPQSPAIFVLFHDTQAYPVYLIVFK